MRIAVIAVVIFLSSSITWGQDVLSGFQKTCTELGFKIKTPGHGECVLELHRRARSTQSSATTSVNTASPSHQAPVTSTRPLFGDELSCQQLGFVVDTSDFAQCKQRFHLHRQQLAQQQREYELQLQRYEAERRQYEERLAEYNREVEREKGRRMALLGFGLMAGNSPRFSDNLANAARISLGQPPIEPTRPSISTFTITSPNGMRTCNVAGTLVSCF